MGFEQRRSQLMARQPEWGDSPSPPHLSKQVEWGHSSPSGSSQSGSDPRDHSPSASATSARDSSKDSESIIDASSTPDALIVAELKTRRNKPRSQPMLSCREWTLESLVRTSKNFYPVPRVRWSPAKSTASQIQEHESANKGVPLVVEGLHNHPQWIKDKFTPEWLERNGPATIPVRNVHDRTDENIPLSDFIARTRAISPFMTPEEKERLYGKDVACPGAWNKFLYSGVIPSSLTPDGPENLLNSLPEQDRPETLMCYLGVGDTFTPCHKDLCASSGHNLMCYTEKGGSSFWFMTATSSANAAAEYFHDVLEQELDHEAHVITVAELAKAPFKVYITEQRLGDLVLVPPRSAHQVVNSGGITIKTSWSRMTVDGLSLALRYELPLYRRVCRAEVYRVKSTIYHTLLETIKKVSTLLCNQPQRLSGSRNAMASTSQNDMRTQLDTLRRVILLFDSILIEEHSPEAHKMRHLAGETDAADDEVEQISCDFCGGDIFQSFFECRSCVDFPRPADPGAGFIVCPGCYVDGRTCGCEVMFPMQSRFLTKLFDTRARAVDLFTVCSELEGQGGTVPSNQQLLVDDRVGLFRAAVVLRRKRIRLAKDKTYNEPRRCTVRRDKELNHDNPNAWVLQCKKCHAGTCLAHITWECRLHAAEALLAENKDETTALLHEAHKASRKRFASEIATLKREKPDYVPDMRIQLAYLATTFSTCRPINGNPNFWKLGYYDLKWETGLPATNQMAIGLQPTSKRPKRLVMDYVLMAPVSRPPKRKDRSDKHVSTTEGNGPPAIIEIDDDDDIPSRKKTKRSHPPRGPPGLRTVIPNSSGPERPATRPRRKAAKNLIVLDESSSSSDSEEELPLKRARLNSRFSKPVPDLRFKPHAAISVADAVNNASALNSKPTPNTLRDPPSSAAAPALPRRKPTRQAASTSLAGRASSSSEGSNNQASPSAIQDQLATIIQALSSVQTTQARQAAEVRDIRARLGGQAPENISDSAATIERQSLSTEATVKVVADLVNGLVSALHQPSPSRSIDLFGSGIRTYSSSHRGRGRGRGGVVFGDHARRSMAPNPEDYRPVRPQHPQQEGLLRRHSDTPTTGRYYEQRIWIPGPHNNQERREEHEERGVQFAEERRPPREGSRPRNFTRFSAPIPSGSGSGLDLVLSNRHSRPLSGRRSRFDGGEETGSDASGTLTNADGPAVNMQMQLRRQTPVGNARGEAPSVSTEKFFRTLSRRSRSPTPDEQDWEAQYEKDGDHT